MQSNLVVTCTTSCTCHHETDLARVNSFNNICFKHRTDESSQARQFRGLNIDCENYILWFNPHTYIFLYVRWLDVPSDWHISTRVDISLLKNEKSLSTWQSSVIFNGSKLVFVSNCSLLSEISIFSRIVRWWHVQSCTGTCQHETNLVTLVSKIMLLNRVRHGSLGVKTSNASPISCGSLLIYLKYVRWLYVPSEVHVTAYRYFFASSRMKKSL